MPRRKHQSESATFHEERKSGIGSSDAAAICGVDPYKTPLQVFSEKRDELERRPPRTVQDKERLYFGQALEDLIAEEYTRRTERKVRRQTKAARHSDHPQLLTHLDRRVYPGPYDDDMEPGQAGVLEIKSPSNWMRDEWADDMAPLHYQIQMQHHLMVTGLMWGAFAVFVGKDTFLSFDVGRNATFIAKLQDAELVFWDRVLRNLPPEPTAADAETLAALYPEEDGDPITLPDKFQEIDLELQQRMKAQRENALKIDELKNKIKAEMGSAPFATLPDGSGMYKWVKREVKGYEVKPRSYRDFRRVKATSWRK